MATRFSIFTIGFMLALAGAALVMFDPYLTANFAPVSRIGPVTWPYKSVLLVLGLSAMVLAAFYLLQKTRDFTTLFLVLIFTSSQLNGIGFGPLDIFDISLLGLFMIWAARIAPNDTRVLILSPLFFAASALVIMTIAHLPVMSPVPWFIGLFGIVRVALIALLFVDLCRDPKALRLVVRVFVVIATISALIGITQFLLAYFNIFVFSYIEPLLSAYKPTPLGFVMRASAFCSTAQHYSSFMVYALPFALLRASNTRRVRDVLAVFIILVGLFVSLNFGGVFAGALVVLLFPFARWPQLSIHLVLAGLAVLAISYFSGLLDLVYDLTLGDSGLAKGIDQRKTLFKLGLAQIEHSPIIGTGVRGFSDVDGNFWGRPVHNLFGQAATELGVFGALLFIGIFLVLAFELIRVVKTTSHETLFPQMMLIVLASAMLLGMTEPNLEQSNLWLMLALSQAVILTYRKTSNLPLLLLNNQVDQGKKTDTGQSYSYNHN